MLDNPIKSKNLLKYGNSEGYVMKTKLLIGFAVGLILSFIGIFKTDLLCMWIGGLFVGRNISILSLVWIKSEELS